MPVSNLTNLIAASARHLDAGAFLTHLGLPWLAAAVVGWFAYRAVLRPGMPTTLEAREADRQPLRVGGAVVAAVLVGDSSSGRDTGAGIWAPPGRRQRRTAFTGDRPWPPSCGKRR
ncbi:MAG: hypothetical protein M3083_13635 [Actinomycetota bacterium]|nr:hypothetical protein [Actinomycetota bacterium]